MIDEAGGVIDWTSDVVRLRDIAVAIENILFKIKVDRYYKCRPNSIKEMSYLQINEEKSLLKRLLTGFEGLYGRPRSPRSIRVVRRVYDRYGELKFSSHRKRYGGTADKMERTRMRDGKRPPNELNRFTYPRFRDCSLLWSDTETQLLEKEERSKLSYNLIIMKLSTITFGMFTVLSLQLVWGSETKDVASSSESSEETATVLQTQKRPKRGASKGYSLAPKSKKLYNKVKVDGPKKDNGIKEGSIPKSSRSLDRQRRAAADLKLSQQHALIDKDLIDDIKKKIKGKWEDFKQLVSKS
ncbi:hypothetical protein ACOME3_001495 [Neoechinorhynchus agilis]